MLEWIPDFPSWLPSWILWIVVLITCIGWLIDKAASWWNMSISKTQNERNTVSLLQDKVQIWKDTANELEEKLKQKEIATGQTEDKKENDDNIEPPKVKSESKESEENEKDNISTDKKTALNDAFDEFDKGNYQAGLKLLKKEEQENNDGNFDRGFLAFAQYTAFKNGSNRALADLEKQNKENPANPDVAIWLAHSYKLSERIEQAKEVLENAINKSEDESSIVSAAKHLTMIYIEEDDTVKAINFFKNLSSRISSNKEIARIYSSVGKIFEEQNDYEKAFMFYEQSLFQDPQNTDLRFDVAHLYGKNSAPKFALFHYRKLLQSEENKMAKNNAGVAADNLALPIISTKYYKEAVELGNSIAASNIAYKLINAGFVEEAEEILKSAEQKTDVHKNVYSAHASIDERIEKENENLENILGSVTKIKKWRQKFGKAIFENFKNPTSLSGVYDGNPGTLRIKVTENGELSGELLLENREEPAEFTGQLNGSGIKFSWNQPAKKKENEKQSEYKIGSILSNWQLPPRNEKGLLIINNQTLQGYSKSGEKSLDPDSNSLTKWKLNKVS